MRWWAAVVGILLLLLGRRLYWLFVGGIGFVVGLSLATGLSHHSPDGPRILVAGPRDARQEQERQEESDHHPGILLPDTLSPTHLLRRRCHAGARNCDPAQFDMTTATRVPVEGLGGRAFFA